jgi:hypothetical protein
MCVKIENIPHIPVLIPGLYMMQYVYFIRGPAVLENIPDKNYSMN